MFRRKKKSEDEKMKYFGVLSKIDMISEYIGFITSYYNLNPQEWEAHKDMELSTLRYLNTYLQDVRNYITEIKES